MSARTRWLLALLSSCLLAGACDGNGDDGNAYTSARLIDRICASGSYQLSGSAELTTGISDDSCGFVIGPEPGSVTLPAEAVPGGMIEALVRENEDEDVHWHSAPNGVVQNLPNRMLYVVDLRVSQPLGSCSIAGGPH